MIPVMIDVDGTPTLFSPVHARTLEPGDLIALVPRFAQFAATTHRVKSRPVPGEPHQVEIQVEHEYADYRIPFMCNEPVLRAVGGRPARGGAR